MENIIGQSLGRYKILNQLGEGGMATVYKAHDTRLDRDVAIKVIRRDAFPPRQLDRILKRFEREAKALAGLSHPNIIKVIDFGEHEGYPYLVMEYLPGGTLKSRLGTPIPWLDAVQLLLPVAEALEYAHAHNIIHRDIKPSNILLTERGQPMLTDFGIAKLLEIDDATTLTGTGIGIGTPEYMAPEQWTGQSTTKSDIYSLGVVLYEIVTGRKPYAGDTPAAILLKQANDPLPRPTTFVRNLPDGVEKILLRALAKKVDDRFSDVSELTLALRSLTTMAKLPPMQSVPKGSSRPEVTRGSAAPKDQGPATTVTGTSLQARTDLVDAGNTASRNSGGMVSTLLISGVGIGLLLILCAGLILGWNYMKSPQATVSPITIQVIITATPNSVMPIVEAPTQEGIDIPTPKAVDTAVAFPVIEPSPTAVEDSGASATVIQATVFLYGGPGMGYDLARRDAYTVGDRFTILAIDRSGSWFYVVDSRNTKGWVFIDWVDLSVNPSLIPTASFIPPAPTLAPTRRPKRSH